MDPNQRQQAPKPAASQPCQGDNAAPQNVAPAIGPIDVLEASCNPPPLRLPKTTHLDPQYIASLADLPRQSPRSESPFSDYQEPPGFGPFRDDEDFATDDDTLAAVMRDIRQGLDRVQIQEKHMVLVRDVQDGGPSDWPQYFMTFEYGSHVYRAPGPDHRTPTYPTVVTTADADHPRLTEILFDIADGFEPGRVAEDHEIEVDKEVVKDESGVSQYLVRFKYDGQEYLARGPSVASGSS